MHTALLAPGFVCLYRSYQQGFNMRKLLLIGILSILGFCNSMAVAAQASQALGVCMADSLTGKERKQLAQWIFFAMSAHPEISVYAKISDADREESHKTVGQLITRLLTENCPDQTKQAIKEGGSLAMQSAFEVVGAVAMQELMANQQVNVSIAGFEKYLDEEKLNALGAN